MAMMGASGCGFSCAKLARLCNALMREGKAHITVSATTRYLRAYMGLSQVQLAKLSGVGVKKIRAIERSDRLLPETKSALEAGGAVVENRFVRWEMLMLLMTPHGFIADLGTLRIAESKIANLLNPITDDLGEAAAALRSAFEKEGVTFLADGGIRFHPRSLCRRGRSVQAEHL